jgi:hypothetical protein
MVTEAQLRDAILSRPNPNWTAEEHHAMLLVIGAKLPPELEILRAEAVRLRGFVQWASTIPNAEATAKKLLAETPATQREVERVKAMERFQGLVEKIVEEGSKDTWQGWLREEFVVWLSMAEEALADYERVVKEKP